MSPLSDASSRLPPLEAVSSAATDRSGYWLRVATLGVAALVVTSWLVIAIAHVDDDYPLSGVSGSWIALARYVNAGIIYPPLHEGGSFGGTRYMPLQFVARAGLA